MKIIFILVALLSFSAQASESKILTQGDIDYCVEISTIAGEIMEHRQNGGNFGTIYKTNMGEENLTKAVRGMVTEAFNVPIFKSLDDKKKAENWFKEKIIKLCIKGLEEHL